MVCAWEGDDPKDTNHIPAKTMTKNTFQSSAKKTSKKETHFLRDTAANIAGGSTAATVTNILGEIVEDVGEAIANKILPGSGKAVGAAIDFAIDSGTAIVLNEGLEVSRDGESFFNDDFVEDALVAVASNATAAVVVGIIGATGAPALALGLLTSAVMGAAYSVATSLDDRFKLPEPGNSKDQTQSGNSNQTNISTTDSSPTVSTNGQDPSAGVTYGPGNSFDESSADHLFDAFLNGTQQEEDPASWETANVAYYERNDGSEYTSINQREYDENGNLTGKYRNINGESGSAEVTDEWVDNDHDGTPSESPEGDQDDPDDSDPTVTHENPMNHNGNTSDYDGQNDELRDFRGDIDYGPDGKQGEGYNGEHNELIGFNPRIDYGPDGKQGEGYNGEHDELIGFDPRIDWDQDHVDTDEFTGNELTKRLGKINPRAIQEALEATTIAENGQQATEMGSTTSAFIFDSQAGVLYHNANGSKKGFGSGGAIAGVGWGLGRSGPIGPYGCCNDWRG